MRQRLLAVLVSGFLVMTAGFDPAAAACDAAQSSAYRDTKIWTITNTRAYFYATGRMAIDADGGIGAR